MGSDLPSGTVTFLFTDVEGSTKLLHELGAGGYADALAEHRRLIREACAGHGGVEVDTQGDAFFFAFATAPGALAAAEEMTEALAAGPIQVRAGVHTGTPLLAEEGYVGDDVHRAARIAASGYGGQVLVSASTAQLVENELRDLGEHRFKDLSAAERVYQLGAGDFPALKSLYRTNLPVPATPFLGRERELAEVVGLLEGTRLLTLTGPGGTGKTRLALQAAGMAADAYPDGVYWVPLAPLRDPELVLEEAAQAVGSANGLAEHIADKRLLLLFDNFEHVVDAAGDVATLLTACPNLDLLVTSREPLHVTGEQEYPVPPLVHEEGVGFFLARARAVKPDFQPDEAVSEICRRLDDLPLALELAAARVKALSSAQILERLEQRLPLLTGGARDLPERQRTLRGAIEWSYELLTVDEQRLFARLSVFRGGCTLDAAEAVCEADLDTLQSLVDKSLLRYAEERYSMLETIHEHASEKLAESGDADEPRRRHADYFLALAEEAEPHLRSGDPKEWLNRLESEHDNVRAAFDFFEAGGNTQSVLRLGTAFWRFWNLKGLKAEGSHRLERALNADDRPTTARAGALLGLGVLSERDLATARQRLEESRLLSDRLGDTFGSAIAKFSLGTLAAAGGDFEHAREILEESVEAFRTLGDEAYELQAALRLAWAYQSLDDLEHARALWEECLTRARATGNRVAEGRLLGVLAGEATEDGRLADASAMAAEALRIHQDLGIPFEIAIDVFRFARLFAAHGEWETAARLAAASDAGLEEIGYSLRAYDPSWVDRSLSEIRMELADDAFETAWAEGATLSIDEALVVALRESESDA